MIFGSYFSNSNFENEDFVFEKSFKEFETCEVFGTDSGKFKGGFLRNKNFPYKNEDIFLSDALSDIFILKSGNVYNKFQLCKEYNLNPNISELTLIKELFLLLGSTFVNEFNGDFFIFIYRPKLNTFYLFRDHLGVIPGAYIIEDQVISFSTDEMGLSKLFQDQDIINIEPLLGAFKFVDLTQCPNVRVKKILPGHFLKFENGNIKIIKYWMPEKIKTNKKLTYNQVINELDFLLKDSVHIRSDKRFLSASHVSGGLDSGVIAALVRKEYNTQEKFYGYSWSPDNFSSENVEFDERELVKETCRMNNIDPIFFNKSEEDYEDLSKNYFRNFGYVTEQKIIKHARKEGVNLIFSGVGGDEFISKGERGINTDLLFGLNWDLFFARNPINKPRTLAGVLLYDIFFPFVNMVNFSQRKIQKDYVKYLKKKFKKNHYASLKNFLFYKSRRQLHLGFINHYHIGERTGMFYINGFLNGIEYRYPFLDKRIVEYMISVPSKILIKGQYSRMVLREISKGILPEQIRWLRKGIDPIAYSNAEEVFKSFSKSLVEKVQQFESNPDLDFVDFEKLKREISKYGTTDEFEFSLYFSLVNFNMIHEFTKEYRRID